MKIKKVFVIGQGSIGKRHIKNLNFLKQNVFVYSYRRSQGKDFENLENVNYVDSIEEGINLSNAVVVCNRNDQHMDVAIKAAKCKKHIFVEKPLSNNLINVEKLRALIFENNLVFNSGFMMRYHPNLIFIKQLIESRLLGDIYYSNAQVGQYLPDWRPNVDYKNNYGAKFKWGGGVTLDLIHEIDLMHWFFGEVDIISCLFGYTPKLEIETETISCINMRSKSNVICNVHLNYLRPVLKRSIEIVGEKGIINWDFADGKVIFSSKKVESKILNELDKNFQRNDLFLLEMEHFLKSIDNNNFIVNEFDDAFISLKTAILAIKSNEKKVFTSALDL